MTGMDYPDFTPLASGRPRRSAVPCTLDTSSSTYLACNIQYGIYQTETPPQSACDSRRYSICSMEPSLSNGSSSTQLTPEIPVNSMQSIHTTDFGFPTKDTQVTSEHFLSFDPNRQNTPDDNFLANYYSNFRPDYPLSSNGVAPETPASSVAFSTFDSVPTHHFDNNDRKWNTGGRFSESRGLNLSLNDSLFSSSSSAYQGSSFSSFNSSSAGLPTPASSFFSSSAPGSACATTFDVSLPNLSMASIAPSQAFQDPSYLSPEMDFQYPSDSSLSTPTQNLHVYPSPLRDNKSSLETPTRGLSALKFESSNSPLTEANPVGSTQRHTRKVLGRARERKRSSKPKLSGTSVSIQTDEGDHIEVDLEHGLVPNVQGKIIDTREKQSTHECRIPRDDGSICDMHFKRNEHLKRHQRMHTNIREHKCIYDDCSNKGISRKDNWGDHLATHNKTWLNRDNGRKGRGRNYMVDPAETQTLLFQLLPAKEAMKRLASIEKKLRRECGPDPMNGCERNIFTALRLYPH